MQQVRINRGAALCAGLMLFFLGGTASLAQQDSDADGSGTGNGGAQEAGMEETEVEDPSAASAGEDALVIDQPGGLEEADDSGEEDEDGDSPGRFIPSEQISQDLGVSFPADI